ncbi:transporter substrate-binding domain-containing protein [Agrococcus jejuensis]|uniref:Solute-binding protein family 3/N-terminal domain-containing protein n=1 Tax=Agrococcus jejuensis TaxID=399736 RepID=A0A1G8DSN5_9MICO|nr:ABC transporter substrate-binding protein [Agrococcus jejuensis]SDH60693.1 hypothetical protein SAMN04489720_1762 [Agrococcus jejuensis]
MRRLVAAVLAAPVLLLAGCGLQIPVDPDGTLDDVRGGTLHVGVSPHEGWAEVVDGQGVGREAELVEGFADSLDAQVEWTEGGEEHLMEALEAGDLDLVIGGLSDATPWTTHAAITRTYLTTTDETGASTNHVMATPLGENAFLVALETFLTEELR